MAWLLRPPGRAYLALRAFASLSLARSVGIDTPIGAINYTTLLREMRNPFSLNSMRRNH